jgi:hypothetical protein
MLTRTITFACLAMALSVATLAQDRPSKKQNPLISNDGPHHIVRRYPADKDVAIAVVGNTTLTLGALVDHIDARHYPGFKKLLETQPTVQAYLRSDLIAPWVRQFADMEALRQVYGDKYMDPVNLEKAQSKVLKENFEVYLGREVERRRQRGYPEISQARVNSLLSEYQLRTGLSSELQGLLNIMEKDTYTARQLRDFFNANPRFMGGQVTLQHILIQHRDGGTGILLNDEGVARANARIAEVQARLRQDGSNFEELVRLYSDDTRTAKKGGELAHVHRFDDRLPATICRAAWSLKDGQHTTDVIESQYGYHFIRRVAFNQNIYILFTNDTMESVRIVMQRAMQERLLLGARRKTKLRLLL